MAQYRPQRGTDSCRVQKLVLLQERPKGTGENGVRELTFYPELRLRAGVVLPEVVHWYLRWSDSNNVSGFCKKSCKLDATFIG